MIQALDTTTHHRDQTQDLRPEINTATQCPSGKDQAHLALYHNEVQAIGVHQGHTEMAWVLQEVVTVLEVEEGTHQEEAIHHAEAMGREDRHPRDMDEEAIQTVEEADIHLQE